MKVREGHDSTDVHETTEVEENIHARVDFIMKGFGLSEILAVPVQSIASHETGEQVICTNCTTGSDKEQLQFMSQMYQDTIRKNLHQDQ